jgi:hypothetical protein
MNCKLERKFNEVIVVRFKILSRCSSGGTKGNHEIQTKHLPKYHDKWTCSYLPVKMYTWYLFQRFVKCKLTVSYSDIYSMFITMWNLVLYGNGITCLQIFLWNGLQATRPGVRFSAGSKDFSLIHSVKTNSVAHLVSYPVGTRGSFPGDKAAWDWSWLPPSSAEVNDGRSISPLPHTSSWHIA